MRYFVESLCSSLFCALETFAGFLVLLRKPTVNLFSRYLQFRFETVLPLLIDLWLQELRLSPQQSLWLTPSTNLLNSSRTSRVQYGNQSLNLTAYRSLNLLAQLASILLNHFAKKIKRNFFENLTLSSERKMGFWITYSPCSSLVKIFLYVEGNAE